MTKNIEQCKALAAKLVVDRNINKNCVIGIGSGSTIMYVVERLVQVCQEKNLIVKCIPTSYQAKQLIHDFNLPLTELDKEPVIDITIDGADEVDGSFVAIKGGGACLTQEKVVAQAAKKFVVVADYRKNVKYLGEVWNKGIPIEVLPMAVNPVRHQLSKMLNIKLEDVVIRLGKEKAGPVITDNGNFVIDWKFDLASFKNSTSEEWKALSDKVKLIPGVIETGIFANMINEAYFGQPDGTVECRTSE